MREVELGWGKVLLVKDNGEFHALGHKCPHYGAPLVKGEQRRGTWEMGYDHPCLYRDSCRPQDPHPFVESPGLGRDSVGSSTHGALENSLWAWL